MYMPQILSIGTALPEHVVTQDDVMAVLDAARDRPMPPRMAEILRNSGIEQRYLAMQPDYYLGERSWVDRAEVYNRVSEELFRAAAERALGEASLTVADIGQIVFVSTTGTMTPSLPSRMIMDMGFAPDTRTLPLFGYGCAGGVLGLSLAADLFRTNPAKPVLLVCLELCSMAYDHQQMGKKDMIALALFADGCAAAVVGSGAGPELTVSASHVWAETINMMGWEIGDTGFDLVLSRDIPAFVRSDFAPVVDAFLEGQGLSDSAMAEPACHPGGGRVVDALADYFNSDLPVTRWVLAQHGNMSSPTVLFVLKALMDAGPLAGPTLLTALGPGFTGALALLRP
jgi:alkylresorcinol/alkylpyrone synthase